MIDILAASITVAALLAAAWALFLLVADRRVRLPLLALLALVELALLVQAVVGFARLLTTDRDVSGLSFGGYLVGSLLVLPIAVTFAMGERSRWAAGVVLVGCVTVPVMVLRLQQIWSGPGA